MTVTRLLREASSRELSEWMVLTDLNEWRQRIQEKTAPPTAEFMLNALFGKALKEGAVTWQKPTTKSK